VNTETVADLVDAVDGGVALRSPDAGGREYDYRRLWTDARKTGNLLSHLGVREGRLLAVADDRTVEVLLGLLGAGLLGAVVRFDPPRSVDARAVLAPTAVVGEYDLPEGGQRVGYGGAPADPATVHLEEEMWSENPTFPPSTVAPGDPLLVVDRTAGDGGDRRTENTYAHGDLFASARSVAAERAPGEEVVLRAPLAHPGTVVAVFGTWLAGATLSVGESTGDVAVATGTAPEPTVLDPRSLA
jgi:hypothetical protein